MFEDSPDQREPDGPQPAQAKLVTPTGLPSCPAGSRAPTDTGDSVEAIAPATAPTDLADTFDRDNDDPATLAALAARWCDHGDPPDPVDAGAPPGWARPADPWPEGWLTPPPGLPPGMVAALGACASTSDNPVLTSNVSSWWPPGAR